MKATNKFNDYPPFIKQLLRWNFIHIHDVEQRHFDAYLKKLNYR